jgi:hypothetical protein
MPECACCSAVRASLFLSRRHCPICASTQVIEVSGLDPSSLGPIPVPWQLVRSHTWGYKTACHPEPSGALCTTPYPSLARDDRGTSLPRNVCCMSPPRRAPGTCPRSYWMTPASPRTPCPTGCPPSWQTNQPCQFARTTSRVGRCGGCRWLGPLRRQLLTCVRLFDDRSAAKCMGQRNLLAAPAGWQPPEWWGLCIDVPALSCTCAASASCKWRFPIG